MLSSTARTKNKLMYPLQPVKPSTGGTAVVGISIAFINGGANSLVRRIPSVALRGFTIKFIFFATGFNF